MKNEYTLFGGGTLFFIPIGLAYGFFTSWQEPVGLTGILLTGGLAGMVGAYLWVTGRRVDPRPEDDAAAEIADGAGEVGVFSPHSWWPLPLALASALCFLGLAVGWWIFYIGAGVAVFATIGWVYEYYRGAHAH